MKEETTPAGMPAKRLKRHSVLAVVGMALVFVVVGQLLGMAVTWALGRIVPEADANVQFLFMYLEFIGIVVLVAGYCALFEKKVFRGFLHPRQGGMRGNTLGNLALGLLVGFLMNAMCVLLAWLHGDLRFHAGGFSAPFMLCGLLCVCVQSGAEELVTRGYMMGALRERYPVWVAIAANAILFAALHLFNPGATFLPILQILVMALAMSLIAYRLDSLWMCIGVHTGWNYTQSLLFGLPNSGRVSEGSFLHLDSARDSVFYNVAFGVEGTVVAVALLAMLALAVAVYARKRSLPAGEGARVRDDL